MISLALKSWMPRSLYWRATLIVVVPVATLLVVGSWVFIQNLYDNVTRQMTVGVCDLADDFVDRQITIEALRTGRTKRTIECTSDLRRNTERATRRLRYENRLDRLTSAGE